MRLFRTASIRASECDEEWTRKPITRTSVRLTASSSLSRRVPVGEFDAVEGLNDPSAAVENSLSARGPRSRRPECSRKAEREARAFSPDQDFFSPTVESLKISWRSSPPCKSEEPRAEFATYGKTPLPLQDRRIVVFHRRFVRTENFRHEIVKFAVVANEIDLCRVHDQ